jgi:hypothetical protein
MDAPIAGMYLAMRALQWIVADMYGAMIAELILK